MSNSAILSSLSSLDRNKQEFNIIAHNVANADNPNYSKLKLNVGAAVTAGEIGGVEILSISTNIDEALQNRLYEKIAKNSYNQTLNSYYSKISTDFGAPQDSFTIDKRISNLFSALDDFSNNMASAGLNKLAVNAFNELANTLNDLSTDLQKMRFDADNEILNSVSEINNLLSEAYAITQSLYVKGENSFERVNGEEKLRVTLEELSQYFNLYKYIDDKGQYKIYSVEGDSLVGDLQYFLKYTPQAGIISFINDTPLNPILLSAYNSAKEDIHIDLPIVTGGVSETISNKYSTGKLGALLLMRDSIIPGVLQQLDILAKNIKDSFNQAHNLGNGFPPPNTLRGTNLLIRDQTLGFTGQSRIAIVDNTGTAVANIPTLDLNFDKLDTGTGPGKANLEGILQEIQYHFGAKLSHDNSVTLGNLRDIKLVSLTKNFIPSSSVTLDIELDNYSQTNSTFNILSATAEDSLGNNILSAFNNGNFISTPGMITRTGLAGPSISLNLPSNINYPFTITLQVNVNDGSVNNSSTLKYVVDATGNNQINGLLNQKFSVNSKVNPSDPAIINYPVMAMSVMDAQLVDIDNNIISEFAGLPGLLQLSTNNNGYHIVIDNLNSSQRGDFNNNILGSGYNFSYFMGLNDIFVRTDEIYNWNNVKNSAIFLDIRDDIKNNSGYLAHSSLISTVNEAEPYISTYQYHVSQSNNDSITKMQALAESNIYFPSAGGLAGYETTISRYGAFIISYVSSSYANVKLNAEQTDTIKNAIYDKLQNIRGVDINEEMANMIIYQQSFAASAKVIQTARELMQILLDAF